MLIRTNLLILQALLIIGIILVLIVSLAETVFDLFRARRRGELRAVEWSDFRAGEQGASETWERLLQDVDLGGLDDLG